MDLEHLEALAFATDRDAALAQLLPGSADHDYYRCVHLQQRGALDEAERIIDDWTNRHNDDRHSVLRMRQLLLRASSRFDQKSREHVRDTFGAYHWHEPETAEGATRLPSKLDRHAIDGPALLREAVRYSADLSQVTEEGLYELLEGDYELDTARRRKLLERLSHTPSPKLLQLISSDLGPRELARFGNTSAHRALTLAQLRELAQRHPELTRHNEWVSMVVQRLRPPAHVELGSHGPDRLSYLRALWAFASGLAEPFASLKLHVAWHLLDEGRRQPGGAVRDRALFVAYLGLPRQASYFGDRWDQVASEHQARLGANFLPTTGLPPVNDDEELIRDYLYAFLSSGEEGADLARLFEKSWFEGQVAEIRLLTGAPDAERFTRTLGPSRAQELVERVELELLPENPRQVREGDTLALELHLKNVAQLFVKVFRIDPVTYFAIHGKPVSADLDLDGLAASHEQVLSFAEPAVRRVRQRIELPQCQRAGCYVIDLIGNGKSSRALIWKGRLRLVRRISAAGQVLTIFDEDGRPRPGARLHLGGREFTPDPSGAITVPFASAASTAPILLVDGDLATAELLTHVVESYTLRVQAHVEREALAASRLARAALRVELLVAGVPAPISLLQKATWELVLTDRLGAVTQRSAPIALDDRSCAALEWKMPDDVAQIALHVRGQVEVVSQQTQLEVSGSLGAELSSMHGGAYTDSLYLARTEAGYVLSALGKSGEPRARLRLPLWVVHRWARTQQTISLDTDDDGRLELGNLAGVESVQATSGGIQHAWQLATRGAGASVTALANEEIAVAPPLGSTAAELLARASLVELRGGHPARHVNAALAVAGQNLVVRGLDAGVFQLRAPMMAPWTLTVLPAQAVRVADHAVTALDLFQLVPAPALIDHVEVTADALLITVRGASETTRLHVIATRFLPAPALGTLESARRSGGRHRDARPSAEYQSGRDLGDETRYVLERQRAARRPGVMLEKPSLLLNPWARQATTTVVAKPVAGGAFGGSPAQRPAAAPQSSRMQAGMASTAGFASLDFVPGDAVLLSNLRPDAQGRVTVARAELGANTCVQLVCVDREQTTVTQVALTERPLAPRDQRLSRALDPSAHITQRRQIDPCLAGATVTVQDLATAKLHIVDTVERAHAYLLSLRDDATLREFEFVTRWHKLSEAERTEKYSKDACHELSLFLYFRDRPTFDRVVAPYLAQKRVQTFIDHWLLGADLTGYLEPRELARRNAFERALLALRLPQRDALARILGDEVTLLPPDPEREARIVEVMLAGAALDDDTSGIQELAAAHASLPMEESLELERDESDDTSSMVAMAAPVEVPPSAPMRAMSMAPPSAAGPRGGGGGEMAKSKKSMRQREESMDKEDLADLGGNEFAAGLAADLDRRAKAPRLFRPTEKTQEWAEHNWWRRRPHESDASMIAVNRFWRDLAMHREGPFLSGALGLACGSFAEAMCALAVLDLPFEAAPHRLEEESGALTIHAACNALVASSQLVPAELTADLPLIVGQSYLRSDDRHHLVEGEYVQKFVSGPLLAGVIYACQVVVANPTGTQQRVSVLVQIPRGSVPTNACKATRTYDVVLPPYAAHGLEVSFYFPRPGSFGHFGAHVAKRGVLIAAAPGVTLQVIDAAGALDAGSWAHVSQRGSLQQVLEVLRSSNLGALELGKVAWRLRDAAAYQAILEVLEARLTYDPVLWSYALWHGDRARTRRWLRAQDRLSEAGPVIDAALVELDAEDLEVYEHLEFAPLINARAHRLGAKTRILNDGFARQLERFLELVAHRARPTVDDHLVAAHYLFAQDRFDDARAHLARAEAQGAKDHRSTMQRDYLLAYSACADGELATARKLVASHLAQPVDRWRKRFAALSAMIDEVEGAATAVVDELRREQVHAKMAATQPAFELAVDGAGVELSWQELAVVELRYFAMDIELLFSRQPFVQADVSRFSYIEPGHRETVPLTSSPQRVPWPATMRGKNVVVEAVAAGQRKAKVHYAHDLAVVVAAQVGQVRVSRTSSKKPAVAAYVKVYARRHDGEVAFFKDGYTDVRGWFDYASLSTDDLDHTARFAILIHADDGGATIVEAAPPPR